MNEEAVSKQETDEGSKEWTGFLTVSPGRFSSPSSNLSHILSMVSMVLGVLRGQQTCFGDNYPPQEAATKGLGHVQNINGLLASKCFTISHTTARYSIAVPSIARPPERASRVYVCTYGYFSGKTSNKR